MLLLPAPLPVYVVTLFPKPVEPVRQFGPPVSPVGEPADERRERLDVAGDPERPRIQLNAATTSVPGTFFASASAPDEVWAKTRSVLSLFISKEQVTITLPDTSPA